MNKSFFLLLSIFLTSFLSSHENLFEPFLKEGKETPFLFMKPISSTHIYSKKTVEQIKKSHEEKNMNLYAVITQEERYPIDLLRIYFTVDKEMIDIDKFIFKKKGIMPISLNVKEALMRREIVDFSIYIKIQEALEKMGKRLTKKEIIEVELFSSGGFKFIYKLPYEEILNLYETAIFYKNYFRVTLPQEPIFEKEVPYGVLMLKEGKPYWQELPSP